MKSFKQTLKEDIQPGYAPDEVTFGGYTTKNLHHSEDAVKAFMSTIDKVNKGQIKDNEGVLHALKATDTYMKLNDMHLEQGKAPDEAEIEQWKAAHDEARRHLHAIGEFMHHMDYWHMHEHELQDELTAYNPETAGAEMADSYEPHGTQLDEEAKHPSEDQVGRDLKARYGEANYKSNATGSTHRVTHDGKHYRSGMMRSTSLSGLLHLVDKKVNNKTPATGTMQFGRVAEELTDKTIRPSDKIKVARVIADMLGVENAEALSPEAAINMGLRKMKTKRMTPEMVAVLKKMLALAQEVGVKVDMGMLPTAVKEAFGASDPLVDDEIMRFKAHMDATEPSANLHSKVGHSMAGNSGHHSRRMKMKYKVEGTKYSADYKLDAAGRKRPAREIVVDSADPQIDEQSVDYDTAAHKEKTADATKKAALILRHAKERESLAHRHHTQKSALGEEAVDPEFEVLDLSDDELDRMADELTLDHLLDALDDDSEVTFVDDETGEEVQHDEADDSMMSEQVLMEVLSRAERMKARVRFLRTKSKRQRRVSIALHRRSDSKTINKRARRIAIKMMKQRIAKKPVSQMTVSEKERVERALQQRKTMIDRLALRMAPKVRKLESDRLRPAAR